MALWRFHLVRYTLPSVGSVVFPVIWDTETSLTRTSRAEMSRGLASPSHATESPCTLGTVIDFPDLLELLQTCKNHVKELDETQSRMPHHISRSRTTTRTRWDRLDGRKGTPPAYQGPYSDSMYLYVRKDQADIAVEATGLPPAVTNTRKRETWDFLSTREYPLNAQGTYSELTLLHSMVYLPGAPIAWEHTPSVILRLERA